MLKSKCFPIIVGAEYDSLRYGKFTVLSYSSASKVLIKFKDTGCERVVTSDLIRRKCIRDTSVELKTLIYGVGDRDIGISEDTNYAYDLWTNMLKRCYSDKHLISCPTYLDCEVSYEFLKFSNFYRCVSCLQGYGLFDSSGKRLCLDKDILSPVSKKIYSSETVCFVPQEVNKFFANKRRGVNKCPTGVSYNADRGKFEAHLSRFGKTLHLGRFDSVDDAVYSYKIGREKFAKELAEKWIDYLDTRVYEKLMNYNEDERL